MVTKKLLLATPLVLLAASTASADDSDIIFLDQAVPPNVVILLDSSGSMDDTVQGSKKIASAKAVVQNLINNVKGVRLGLFRFNGSDDGGDIVFPTGTDEADMLTGLNAITADGLTPLGRAAQDVEAYFNGDFSGCLGGCGSSWGSYSGGSSSPSGWSWDGHHHYGDWGGSGGSGSSTPVDFPSPIEYECQSNYAIFITDGLPNGEDVNLVSDVATSLYTTDHSDLPGMQNVIVHTVGFDVPQGKQLLTDTATNGGGSFYTASDATELEDALLDVISNVIQDNYSFSAPLIPSTGVAGGTHGYLASFEPDPIRPFWSGYLKAYTLDASGRVPLTAEGLPDPTALAWDAGALLAAQAASSRTIYTVVSGSRQTFAKTNGSLTSTLLAVSTSTERDKVIDFIRGTDSYDADADGNVTEDRAWKLGDVFHSQPVLVFPPPLNLHDTDYQTFKTAHASRTAIVLVGANDGMLHAFRSTDGVELWGFVPPSVLPNLQDLTPKVAEHPYFVDGSPVVADVKTGGSWKTIVVSGARRGSPSYFALDLTDTTSPQWLWSFTDAEMGESWSEPVIGKVRMDDGSDKWVAFVGGGYNTAANNATGRAVFAIDLASGTKLWSYGTGGSNDAQYMNFSVPARPAAVDLDRDGYLDRLYVGDIGGQLWKFDVSTPATTASGVINNWTGKRLFVAAPSQTNPPAAGEFYAEQAMYGTPILAYDHDGALWVFVGTGDRNHPKSPSSNLFYAIKDDTSMTNGSALTASSLVDVTSGDPVTQGWYYALDTDEKVLSAAEVFNGLVLFTTFTPESTDVCEAANGNALLYALRMDNGKPGVDWPTGNPLPDPDGSEDPAEDAGEGIPSSPDVILGGGTATVVVGNTEGELTEVSMPSPQTKRVRYWREVF